MVVLAIVVVAVHAIYILFIRPEAGALLEAARLDGKSVPRSFSVILKDVEQQICVTLMFWSVYLIIRKIITILKDDHLCHDDHLLNKLAHSDESLALTIEKLNKLPEDESSGDKLSEDERQAPLVKILASSIQRYQDTGDVQNTANAIDSGVEALAAKQEAENSMIRYLIWAIPSIGFIGTVRGIGIALSQADKALAGDIAAMTDGLGIAFNSTLVALLISILLMLLLHYLQHLQDGLVVDIQSYCEEKFLKRISKKDAP